MRNEHKEELSEVFCDVLMNYAFMFGDVCPKDELASDGDSYIHSTISFSGDQAGILGISTSPDLCLQLAANVLGIDIEEENSMSEAYDALKELINIVCGQFLTKVYGDTGTFDLSPPNIIEISGVEWKSLIEDEETIGIIIDDIPAIVYALSKSA